VIEPRKAVHGRGEWLFTGWRGYIVGLIAAITCLLAMVSAVDVTRLAGWIGHDGRGDLGFRAHVLTQRAGWSQIDSVAPTGPAKTARLATGMVVRFDRAYETHAELLVGRTIGLSMATSDAATKRPRHLTLIAEPDTASVRDPYRNPVSASVVFAAWFCVALGIVAVVRGWGSVAALAVGLGIFSFPLDLVVPLWATSAWEVAPFLLICAVMGSAVIGRLLLPAALYYERIGRPRWPWLAAFGAMGLTLVVARVLAALRLLDETRFAQFGDRAFTMTLVLVALGLGLGLYWAWRGWHDGVGADRRRFAALLATNLVTVLVTLADTALAMAPGQSASTSALLFFIQLMLTHVLVPLALAYAVLRHRVVDIGFALNRMVVFGSVSALLLGSFGLIEWGIEHWLPESWVNAGVGASVWIGASAALLVYLAFHRIHDAVEHRVEHLFFHAWQSNEAILRRFVGSAPHFEDERALARSFADELSRFAGEARVALYRRKDRTHDAILERITGSWDTAPRTLPIDDPAFALMRAERAMFKFGALDLSDTLTDLPGVLALPMLDHGVLTGLVLMDLKGNGALYRPDEIAVLGWAAHDVALALAALHAGLVESENRLLKAQLARLGSLIGDRLNHAGA
jgi:hypothetical protein